MRHFVSALAIAGALACTALSAAPAYAQDDTATAAAPASPAWVETSNAYTQKLIAFDASFSPEGASSTGYEQYDGLAFDLAADRDERYLAGARALRAEFVAALGTESDPYVKQDLEILIGSLDESIAGVELNRKLMLDWTDVPEAIYFGVSNLLDERISPERQQKAVELLQRYTGTYKGTTALTEQAKARFLASQGDGKTGPYDVEVRDAVAKYPTYAAGIRELFTRFKVKGADKALKAMDAQFADYGQWTTATVLPAARTTAPMPRELYALNLRRVGIDIDPQEAMAQARRGYYELRAQMDALAPEVAAKFGFAETDYIGVLNQLKKQTIPNDQIEAYYRDINAKIEEKMVAAGIATLPDTQLQMRLASPAEAAAQPAPHMSPPRLIGNTGEQGQFILTAGNPTAGDGDAYDDFNHPAAAWTLSAHEARPGHEMQFAALVKQGVSLARLLYAFNSTNVEGWALYAEAEMLPLEPVEGQLIALQFRQLRAARAMLDPMLNLGMISREEAGRVLREEVGFSPGMVKQELDRYQFRAPGQAGSYYYGYRKLIDLRVETELALGEKFDRLAFNNFLLSQGIIPLDLIAKAVREEFVPAQLAK
ncbi:DUF885 domain-containing protein [Erythrobacter sp. SDW2]|uniref:DUF885 domain-containing protein n=1 Tax=Erythrobacter sp. SDW2 TaxID=2907154 RepID=UPI001F2215BF|nr:DUF885 domain-containing protein [Erythrobacter sp. SDW2]UIP06786.1 DUF885 domain-containing protein [Erythrobacter sp. SDW2]